MAYVDNSVDNYMSATGLLFGEVFCCEATAEFGSICSFFESKQTKQGQSPVETIAEARQGQNVVQAEDRVRQ